MLLPLVRGAWLLCAFSALALASRDVLHLQLHAASQLRLVLTCDDGTSFSLTAPFSDSIPIIAGAKCTFSGHYHASGPLDATLNTHFVPAAPASPRHEDLDVVVSSQDQEHSRRLVMNGTHVHGASTGASCVDVSSPFPFAVAWGVGAECAGLINTWQGGPIAACTTILGTVVWVAGQHASALWAIPAPFAEGGLVSQLCPATCLAAGAAVPG
eukprot:6643577-Prymnesium_polylepis.1